MSKEKKIKFFLIPFKKIYTKQYKILNHFTSPHLHFKKYFTHSIVNFVQRRDNGDKFIQLTVQNM